MNDPRWLAWKLVRSGDGATLRRVAELARRHELARRDRALLRRLVDTEARRRGTLRAILHEFEPRRLDPDVAVHAQLGIAQLFFFDRVPEHAAISETTDLVRRTVSPGAARMTKTMLRAIAAARIDGRSDDPRRDVPRSPWHVARPVFRDPAEHPLLWAEDALSMPAALMKRWSKRFGDETARKLAWQALEEPPLSLRAVRVTRDELAAELEAHGVPTRPGAHERILLASRDHTERALSSPALEQGRATVQGETALRAALAVEPREGERILDLCAAPGGKTAVLAESGARVVASDVSAAKLERLESTLERLKLRDRVELVAADELDRLDERSFDAVLVDAPCTNTGVLARRPEARWRFGPQTKGTLIALQADLASRAARWVKPGGRVVYSTCSIESDENAQQVKRLLAAHPGWTLEADHEALPDLERGDGAVDGGYWARLRA